MDTENTLITQYDAVIVGAGAAGLFAAGRMVQQGLNVLVVEHSSKVAEKVRISGGGRCNFTNRDLEQRQAARHFVSQNPHFSRSALARFTPQDFIDWLTAHQVKFHEKHKGQLFCDGSSKEVIAALLRDAQGAQLLCNTKVLSVQHVTSSATTPPLYHLELEQSEQDSAIGTRFSVQTPNLVVASGGLSIPKIGASDWGYRLAKQFAIPLIETSAGLVPFVWSDEDAIRFQGLAGVAVPVRIACGEGKQKVSFDEDLLFTHVGLSGPAALQISNYWHKGQTVSVDFLAPHAQSAGFLERTSRKQVVTLLAQLLPKRLAERWLELHSDEHPEWSRPMAELSHKSYASLLQSLRQWQFVPRTTEGYKKAEVTRGGVDTRALSSQTMESTEQAGLYFIGEVVDVTGWLGGYNFQWAWASAAACAQAIADKRQSQGNEPCG